MRRQNASKRNGQTGKDKYGDRMGKQASKQTSKQANKQTNKINNNNRKWKDRTEEVRNGEMEDRKSEK